MEHWKPIKNYEGLYEISDWGRVKSLAKIWVTGRNTTRTKDATILKQSIDSYGYYIVCLRKNGKGQTVPVHLLVWDYFGDEPRNGRMLQVDHKDENKLNNHIDNLQRLTPRENTSKYYKTQNKTSKYTGVCLNKLTGEWISTIFIDGVIRRLGSFKCETAAMIAYQQALFKIKALNQK